MAISAAEIKRQFNRAKTSNWLPWFQQAADRIGTSTAHLLAHGSRETNLKNIRGDFRGGIYHGFGVMQVDIGTDADYAKNWTSDKVEPSIRRGAEILSNKIDEIIAGQGKRLKVKGRAFIGKRVEDDDVRRIATAAYNCGMWAFFHFSRGENVDSTTTGHDYSRDVYDRAIEFAALLEEGGIEPGALKREVELQGKYARKSARERAGLPSIDRVSMPMGDAMDDQTELARVDYHVNPDGSPANSPTTEENQATADAAAATVAPTVVVSPIEATKAAVPGGGVDDEPQQASTGGGISRALTGVGGLAGIAAAIKGFMAGNTGIIMVSVVCVTALILALIFRQVLLDWLRMKLHADPSKINVK